MRIATSTSLILPSQLPRLFVGACSISLAILGIPLKSAWYAPVGRAHRASFRPFLTSGTSQTGQSGRCYFDRLQTTPHDQSQPNISLKRLCTMSQRGRLKRFSPLRALFLLVCFNEPLPSPPLPPPKPSPQSVKPGWLASQQDDGACCIKL
jgi:hypothetical protein